MIHLRLCALVLGIVGIASLTGCGGGEATTPLEVKVVSSKVKLEDTDSIEVVFTPESSEGKPATANGSVRDQPLKAKRADLPGVVPGKYKLSVKISPYSGMGQERAPVLAQLNNTLTTETSGLVYEVTSEPNQSITIDLDAKTVTKNASAATP